MSTPGEIRGAAVGWATKALDFAYSKHPRRHASYHESYAVLLEEVEELWEAVRKDESAWRIASEAVQVAASAMRLIADAEDRAREQRESGQ
jgi:hypothetical protein